MASADGEAGFTLLEIIVALVVLGVLFATLSQGVRFGFASWGRQDQALRTGEGLSAVDRTLRRLVEQMDPGSERDGATLAGRAHAMAFMAPLPSGAGTGAVAPAADMRLRVQDGRLLLSWLPHRHAVRVGPVPAPQTTMLMDGIAGIDLGYWSDASRQWSTTWTGNTLPDLVRIRLLFGEHDPRHWPDIVEAPARAQVPG
ncbi:PulJ/GspJ family protein [Lichenicoccus roseus]|uniref:Prepilin-type N-terminal cleavage/methylation domain-containing protein n=1 Tax=Lichenicoccus roseus TaxID=2683649 RepID=A0A5R9J205_9PROT|nr:prepilin-type N-terminal cleavage/methylation domain-containing protein [Lichenicoccus roseus]TLU71654.1 prepilin-type N-terminal cleavage/methylation domain-containing protein [Lichenicoccus roseus]